jgi:hypothetical protein
LVDCEGNGEYALFDLEFAFDFMEVVGAVCIVVPVLEEESFDKLFIGRRPDDFAVEYFVNGVEAPLASAFDSVWCRLPIDEDFPTVEVVVCPVVALCAPLPVAPATFDPGTSVESAAFIRFPTLDPRRRDRDVLFSPTPSASRFFLAA